ncbi:hypothetical protein KXS07_11400 [Inquilinus limosus]|uniref:hypothetical protein n=1 Tax=Inquilinus limosus TaxID=171674 RepID=UPI003F150923
MTDTMDNLKAYVQSAEDTVSIKVIDGSLEDLVCGYKAVRHNKIKDGIIEYYPDSDIDRANILKYLRDIGVCFSYGKEWSPSEIFEELRDKGLIDGKYNMVTWTGGGKYFVQER